MKYCATCNATYPTGFNTCPKDQTVLRVTSELMQGMVIRDKYQVLEKIGAGGMASVYRVKHLAFNEERAIKVVSAKLMDDPNFIKRFRTEAMVTRKLQHPNAVRVDDLDTTEDGRLFMVMEYVQGRDLRAVLQQCGPLPLERTLHITWQVASALATAHQLGITHRDIKPDNILLVPQAGGRELAKVLDFGIAKVREGAMDVGGGYTATQTGMVVGTPQYISPEQAMGKSGDQIDGRADLYSLAVVIYEMLTGKQPFESDTAMGLLLHHLQTVPTPPHLMRPDLKIPPAISMALMKALEKDPAKRFQNANQMLEALAGARQQAASQTGVATKMITPTVMAAAGSPTPTLTPTVAAPAPVAAAPKPAVVAVDKTIAVAAPKKEAAAAPRPVPRRAPAPPPSSRKWVVPALIAALVVGALGFVARQRQKLHQSIPAVQQTAAPAPAPAAETKPAEPPAAEPTPAALQEKPAAPPQKPRPAVVKAAEAPPKAKLPVTGPGEPAASGGGQPMDPEVRRLLVQGKQQYQNGKYGMAIASFRSVLALDPDNQWAKRGIEACQQARQQQAEQILQSDQAQSQPNDPSQNVPRWRRKRPN